MITVSFENIRYKDGFVKVLPFSFFSVTVEGHALWGIKGNDPLCAAVSALSQTMILTLGSTKGIKLKVEQRDGFLKAEVKLSEETHVERTEVILEFFLRGIAELAIIDSNAVAVTFG